jgi:MFS family permease
MPIVPLKVISALVIATFTWQLAIAIATSEFVGIELSLCAAVGLALSYEAAFLSGAFGLGHLIKRICRRTVVRSAWTASVLAFAVVFLAPLLELMVLGRILGGISAAALWIVSRRQGPEPCGC